MGLTCCPDVKNALSSHTVCSVLLFSGTCAHRCKQTPTFREREKNPLFFPSQISSLHTAGLIVFYELLVLYGPSCTENSYRRWDSNLRKPLLYNLRNRSLDQSASQPTPTLHFYLSLLPLPFFFPTYFLRYHLFTNDYIPRPCCVLNTHALWYTWVQPCSTKHIGTPMFCITHRYTHALYYTWVHPGSVLHIGTPMFYIIHNPCSILHTSLH